MDPGPSIDTAHGSWKAGKRQDRGSAHSLPCAPIHGHHLLDPALCNVDGTILLVWVSNAWGPGIVRDKTRVVMDSPDAALVLSMTLVRFLYPTIPPSRFGCFQSSMHLVHRIDRNKHGLASCLLSPST